MIVSRKEDSRLVLWAELAYSFFLSTSIIGAAVMWLGFIPYFFDRVPIFALVIAGWLIYLLTIILLKRWTDFVVRLKESFFALRSSM